MSILNKVFDYMKATDFDDEYEENDYDFETGYEEPQSNVNERVERQPAPIITKTENEKILSMNTKKDYEIVHYTPEDSTLSPTIAKAFKEGKLCIINVSNLSDMEAQTTADFIAGATFALNGAIKPISEEIFIAIPSTISYRGDIFEDVAKTSNLGFFR